MSALHAAITPRRLRPGDTVAAVTLSWGGPGTFPDRYAAGKRQFEQEFGVSGGGDAARDARRRVDRRESQGSGGRSHGGVCG